MKKHYLLLALALLTGTLPLSAQTDNQEKTNEVSVSVQLRPRTEYRNGALIPRYEGQDAAFFTNNRSRLSIDFNRPNLSMGFSIQQVGVWGDAPQVNLNNSNVQMKESWAQLKSKETFIKFGRQILSYDDERILGALDWNMSGRSHDAVKFGYENAQNKLHFILAYNQNKETTAGNFYDSKLPGQPYKTMQAIYYQHTGSKTFIPSVLFLNIGVQTGTATDAKIQNMKTLGTHLIINPTKELSLTGSAYIQFGKNTAGTDISAHMFALKANYDFTKQWALTLGTDYLSGESNSKKDSKYSAFNPLYGTHHKFYGTMDYFFVSPFATGYNPGLNDNYLTITYKPSAKYVLSGAYHYFAITSDNNIHNQFIALKKGLGSEFDLQFDWAIMKDVKLMCGYSFMNGTETMDFVKGGDYKARQDWGWLSINVNPKVFSTKW